MKGALLRKELRELLPWAILGVAVSLVDLVEIFIQQVDMRPLGQTFIFLNDYDNGGYWFIAVAIGTGLVTREHVGGTRAVRGGLPLSRSRSFFAKAAVMAAIVLIPPFGNTLMLSGMHLISRGSLDEPLQAPLLAEALASQALLVVNGLFLGAAFGRLRSLAWLVLGVAMVGLQLLGEFVPRIALLNPISLLDWQWLSNGLTVDPETLRTQAALTAGAFVVAWHGFVTAGKSRLAALATRPVLGAAVTVATIGVGAWAMWLMMGGVPREPTVAGAAQPQGFQFAPSPPAQTVTEHYRLSYQAHESAAARALAAEADAIFERVHALLGVPLGGRIDVDASGSIPNTHGTAFDGRIQMRLSSYAGPVLAHETAHVVAQRMAGEQSAWLWGAAPVLNEGLASWVEAQFRGPSTRAADRLLVLAALHTRRELSVDELANPALLGQLRDENLKYPAGEAIIGAVIELYGEAAIPRLLAAFADPRLPTDLRGLPLWQSTFQLAGMDLGAVLDEFFRNVSEFAEEHAERIAALPRPRVRLVRIADRIGAIAVIDSRPGSGTPQIVLRFKPEPDSPSHLFRQADAVAGVPSWLRRTEIAGGRVCVQPGLEVGDEELLFEPWSCIPTSDAETFGRQ
jgi:hypothetical protein